MLVLTVIGLFSTGAEAQRAVTFGGSTYLANPGFSDSDLLPAGGSPDGTCSLWLNTTTLPAQASRLIAAYAGAGNTLFDLEIVNGAAETPPLSAGAHFILDLRDATGANYTISTTNNTLPLDGAWHHFAITWDMSNSSLPVEASLDGVRVSWASILTNTGNTFVTPYPGARWAVGADVTNNGTAGSYYKGSMAELFCHFAQSDYMSILNPDRPLSNFARLLDGITILPLDLGPQCEAVFGPPNGIDIYLPAICMRGGPAEFPLNQGGDTVFTVNGRALGQPSTDPFVQYP